MQKLGAQVFEEVYNYLKGARHQNASETEIREYLEQMVPRASDCFEVDQLLYFEEVTDHNGESVHPPGPSLRNHENQAEVQVDEFL